MQISQLKIAQTLKPCAQLIIITLIIVLAN